jgi:hypothetical protein
MSTTAPEAAKAQKWILKFVNWTLYLAVALNLICTAITDEPLMMLPQGPAASGLVRLQASQLLQTAKADPTLRFEKPALLAFLRDITAQILVGGDAEAAVKPTAAPATVSSAARTRLSFIEKDGELQVQSRALPAPTAAEERLRNLSDMRRAREQAAAAIWAPVARRCRRSSPSQSSARSSAALSESSCTSPPTRAAAPLQQQMHPTLQHQRSSREHRSSSRRRSQRATAAAAAAEASASPPVQHRSSRRRSPRTSPLQRPAPRDRAAVLRAVFAAAAEASAASAAAAVSSSKSGRAGCWSLMEALLQDSDAWTELGPAAMGAAAAALRAMGCHRAVSWHEFCSVVGPESSYTAAAAAATERSRRKTRSSAAADSSAVLRGVFSDGESLDLSNCHFEKLGSILAMGPQRRATAVQ